MRKYYSLGMEEQRNIKKIFTRLRFMALGMFRAPFASLIKK